jgi:hypothetical protein
MAQAAIVSSEKTFSTDPARQGKVDRIVVYKTDKDALNHFVIIPDETYSLQNAEAAIRKAEAERVMQTPHTFQY